MNADASDGQRTVSTRVPDVAPGLEERRPGLWVSPSSAAVSYPESGSREYREVEDRSFWFRHRNRCIVELFRRHPPAGAVFDIGGGNGVVAAALAAAGFDMVVVEPSMDGALGALERGLRPVICSTAAEARFRPATLPAVSLFDVVEHIADDIGFLRDLHRVLRQGGLVYATVPAYQGLWSAEDEYAGHHRRYTMGSLRETLTAAGFEVVYATYFFTVLPFAILPFRTVPSLFGRRRHRPPATEHLPGGPVLTSLIVKMLSFELAAIRRGVTLPMGGSCLVVARAAGESADA